jgi:hypothetical protein
MKPDFAEYVAVINRLRRIVANRDALRMFDKSYYEIKARLRRVENNYKNAIAHRVEKLIKEA